MRPSKRPFPRLKRWAIIIHSTALCAALSSSFAGTAPPLPADPQQRLERTCFQTGQPWSGVGNLRSDVAIVYGIGPDLPERIETWRRHGYLIHVMTGVAWGNYQNYISGAFDGVSHQDERQTDRNGRPHSHGGDVYYMCPGANYGKFLCVGIQRALDAGAEAIHLEEPEFWVQDGYEEGFRREWRSYYGEDWQPPHSSVDAQWRASKLKYYLYRRALQQVFDYVGDYNRRSGRHVRCYIPTHSLLNYAHWRIVSPESSLAWLKGCDGYIAQVWTGTSRTPNVFRGVLRERTFETAFLEYGAMQNLVRATGRTVWYLNDPVEDDPNHTWQDYRANWESTLTASLLQPEVWQYEVAPWPERVFGGRYRGKGGEREAIPPEYATELQTVMNALNQMEGPASVPEMAAHGHAGKDAGAPGVEWDCGTKGIGVLVSDSLMFERGDPAPSDPHLSHVYGLALPLLKRGLPVTPVQLENVTAPHYLDGFRVLLLSYQGMKPLSSEVHEPLAAWVKKGGVLVVVDDETDPFNRVREWWNSDGRAYATPREHLFETLGQVSRLPSLKMMLESKASTALAGAGGTPALLRVGQGAVIWLRENPTHIAASADGDLRLLETVKRAASAARLKWSETTYLILRRGPFVIAVGLDESMAEDQRVLRGRFVNLFDPELRVRAEVQLAHGARFFLIDLERDRGRVPRVLAAACKALLLKQEKKSLTLAVEGVAHTQALVLVSAPGNPPSSIKLAGQPLTSYEYSAADRLVWIRFKNEPVARELEVRF